MSGSESTLDLILADEPRLRRFARRFVRCEADVDDLVQETLLRAYRARDRFTPGTSLVAWTSTILRRLFLTGRLSARRRATDNDTDADEPLEAVARAAAPTKDEMSPSFDDVAETLEDPLKNAIARVPEIYRTPFLMASIENRTCGEIAALLDIPAGTVMSRIHRARLRIKRALAPSETRTPRSAKSAIQMRSRTKKAA